MRLRSEALKLSRRFGFSLGLFCALHPFNAFGCAVVRGPIPTAEDYIQAEQAVIIWDEAHKTEHFIRQADIYTKDPDLGFLVPTPTVPQLVEADSRIFKLAAEVGQPTKVQEIIHPRPFKIFGPVLAGPLGIIAMPMTALLSGMSNGDQPEILSEQNVAGYHAVTLAADNPAVLTGWLRQNNYEWTSELAGWLKPYVDHGWKLTAFKLIKRDLPKRGRWHEDEPIVTGAIRLSFTTDQPFFPYSEPRNRQQADWGSPYGRTLRIAVLSAQRMQGAMKGIMWPGNLQFAGSPDPGTKSKWKANDWLAFAKLNGTMTLPATLTYWRDDSNPRPGYRDLYFSPDQDQSLFRREVVDYSIPALHRIELNHPIADLAALLIVVLLPGAPVYCGFRLIQNARREKVGVGPSPDRLQIPDRVLGLIVIIMGSAYGVGCFALTYWLHRIWGDEGYPVPGVCLPQVTIPVGVLFLILIDAGSRLFRPGEQRTVPLQMRLRRYWLCFLGVLSLFVGVCFALAMIVRLFIAYSD